MLQMQAMKTLKTVRNTSLKKNELIPIINSKYTYAHVFHFHQTILTILGNKELSHLSISDLKNIVHFINLIIQLLELPQITYQNQSLKTDQSNYPKIKLKGIGERRRSKKCLRALLKWIEQLNSKKHLTLETLLNEYYNNFPFAQQIQTTETILPNRSDLSGKHPSTQRSDKPINTPRKMRTSVHTLNNIIKPPD
jgi:hypothetical protein